MVNCIKENGYEI